jgi:hypothetical protein
MFLDSRMVILVANYDVNDRYGAAHQVLAIQRQVSREYLSDPKK